MPQPPLQVFDDDANLAGHVGLIRRLALGWVDWNQVDENGLPRVSSVGFQLQTLEHAQLLGYPGRCMSFSLESDVRAHPDELGALLKDQWVGYGLARVSVELLRDEDFGIQHVPEPGEPWHVVAFPKTSVSRARRAQSPLADGSTLLIAPDQK